MKPEALRLADWLDAWGGKLMMPLGWRKSTSAELRRLQGLIDDCAIYLKEGETPAQRIARDHGDSLVLMELLAREKRKNETLLEALNAFVSVYGVDDIPRWMSVRDQARAAIAKAEGEAP